MITEFTPHYPSCMTINSLCLLTNEDLPLVLRVVGDVEGPILQLVLRPRQSDRMETILRHIHISEIN